MAQTTQTSSLNTRIDNSPCTHLVEDASHAPNVGAPGIVLALTDLRGEIVWPQAHVFQIIKHQTAQASTPDHQSPKRANLRLRTRCGAFQHLSKVSPSMLAAVKDRQHTTCSAKAHPFLALAMPKSPIFMLPQGCLMPHSTPPTQQRRGPLLDRKKFPDFKSLWRMCRSWIYLRARIASILCFFCSQSQHCQYQPG